MTANAGQSRLTALDRQARERILVIDDEKRMCDSLESLLTDSGYEVETFQDSDCAAKVIQSGRFDLIVSDIKMPGMSGIDLLQLARDIDPQALVVLMTGYGSLETAIEAINRGAYDYLLKPVEFPQLELVIKRGLERRRLGRAKSYLLSELQEKNRELSDRLEEINALYTAGKTLGSTIDLDSLLAIMIDLATNVLHANIGSIMLLDEERQYLSIEAAKGLPDDIIRTTKMPIGSSISGHVAQTGEPLFISNVENDSRFQRENREERYGHASLLSVPLMVKNQVLGVINMAHKMSGGEFDEHDLKLLTTFANQAAVAIDNAATFRQLKRRVAELSTLQEISDAMSRAGSVINLQEIIFWGLRNLMPADMSLWFRWSDKSETLTFSGGAGNAAVDLQLTIKTTLDEINTPDKARELILEYLPPAEESNIPTTSFLTFLIRNETGLAYIFCLSSQATNCFSSEDEKIAGLIAGQAAAMYEREKSILNATRLLTMGNMISEISHDMRKPLTNIRGGLQIMRSRWPELADQSDLFKMAEEEVHRLNELVRELVDFSNPNKYQTERTDICAVLERALQLIKRDMEEKGVTPVTKFEDDLPGIFVNKNQIMEMFLNLLINAVDSISQGGTVTVKVSSSDFDTRKMIKVVIADTGCGIADADKAAIFDRYYTTKDTGTGLGLAVVERIISAHGGRIEVESEKDVGTKFTIYLPR